MALADVLAAADFFDLLRIADVKFRPMWKQQLSEVDGDTLVSDRGTMRFKAECKSVPMPHAEAESMLALIRSRQGSLRKILAYNAKLPYPSTDPTGSAFGAATPVIASITDRRRISFSGFPTAGYVIPRGTWFQIIWDTSRYYIGQFDEAKTADGSGVVSTVEVSPPLPLSITVGAAVTVKKPAGKFRIVADSEESEMVDLANSTISFSADQSFSP